MKHAIRKVGALGVFTAILAGMLFGAGITARDAGAHPNLTNDEIRDRSVSTRHVYRWSLPGYVNSDIGALQHPGLRVKYVPYREHNSIRRVAEIILPCNDY